MYSRTRSYSPARNQVLAIMPVSSYGVSTGGDVLCRSVVIPAHPSREWTISKPVRLFVLKARFTWLTVSSALAELQLPEKGSSDEVRICVWVQMRTKIGETQLEQTRRAVPGSFQP